MSRRCNIFCTNELKNSSETCENSTERLRQAIQERKDDVHFNFYFVLWPMEKQHGRGYPVEYYIRGKT